jgi:hypothetical protein
MTRDEVIAKIKTRGYWRINFEPQVLLEKLSIQECKDLMEKSVISLRGWNYPHIPNDSDSSGTGVGNNFYEGWFESPNVHIKEFWRLYQSGQFIHYVSTHYDWLEDYKPRNMWMREDEHGNGPFLGAIDATYQITEIFQFLERLTKAGLYEEGVNVSITLYNTAGRSLIVDHPSRIPFTSPKQTQEPFLLFGRQYTKGEILADPKKLTEEAVIHFFIRFKWLEPNVGVIRQDIENLLAHKA